MKVVLDTNVLVSGLMLPDSVPGRIVAAWRSAQFELAMLEPLLDEIGRVLSYPKIQGRLRWGQDEIARFLLLLRFKADIVDIASEKASVPRDPGDDPVLATLLAADAGCLVGGDSDLLALRDRLGAEWKGAQSYWSARAREKGLLKEEDLDRFLRRR